MTGSATDPTVRQIRQRAVALALLPALLSAPLLPAPFTLGLLLGGLFAQLNFFLLARTAAGLLRGTVARARLLAWCACFGRYALLLAFLAALAVWRPAAAFGAALGLLTIVGAILTSLAVPFSGPAPAKSAA